jgi:MFS family permease
MKIPDAEHQIQTGTNVGEAPSQFQGTADSFPNKETMQRAEQRLRTLVAGVVFGAFVGLLMGAVVGAACCWLTDQFDFLWLGVLIDTLFGPFAGAVVAFTERKIRGDLISPDIATIVCVVFALLPAVLIGLQGIGGVRGKISGYLFLAGIFIGPMIGLVIGATLDRAFDEYRKKAWGRAIAFTVTGVALCLAAVCLIDSAAYGPDPVELAREARTAIAKEWSKDPDMQNATIQNVTLVRKGRRKYIGSADVSVRGQRESLVLEVLVDGGMLEVNWSVEPAHEHRR